MREYRFKSFNKRWLNTVSEDIVTHVTNDLDNIPMSERDMCYVSGKDDDEELESGSSIFDANTHWYLNEDFLNSDKQELDESEREDYEFGDLHSPPTSPGE